MESLPKPRFRPGHIGAAGWVHALTSPDQPGVVKIGSAPRFANERWSNPDEWLQQWRPWRAALRVDAADCLTAEKGLSKKLKAFRVPRRLGMLSANLEDVLAALEQLFGPLRPAGRIEYEADQSRVTGEAKAARFALRLPNLDEWVARNYDAIQSGWPTAEKTAARLYAEWFPDQPAFTSQGIRVAIIRARKSRERERGGLSRGS